MSPLDYANRYWSLQVVTGEGTNPPVRTVRIHRYRLVNMTGGADPSLPAKDSLVSAAKKQFLKDGGVTVLVIPSYNLSLRQTVQFLDWGPFGASLLRPFIGKGSPEEVQVVLQLAIRYGLATEANLQKYADDSKIGLDCNGFVGNYLRQLKDADEKWIARSSDTFSGSSRIRDIFQHAGRRIRRFEDVTFDGMYLMGLVDGSGEVVNTSAPAGHITISQPFTVGSTVVPDISDTFAGVPVVGGPLQATTTLLYGAAVAMSRAVPAARPTLKVVESTAADDNGLVSSTYTLLSVSQGGIFTVERGLGMGRLKVQIFRKS